MNIGHNITRVIMNEEEAQLRKQRRECILDEIRQRMIADTQEAIREAGRTDRAARRRRRRRGSQ